MAIKYNREKISEGIHYNSIINKREKANGIVINFITKLAEETSAKNAIIPYLLASNSKSYPTITAMNKKLSELYGASLKGVVLKIGDSQHLSIIATCIDDKYTFDGEPITEKLTNLMMDCIINPNIEDNGFAKQFFELKKQELIDDIEAEINEKRSYAFKRANQNVFRGEPAALTAKGDKSHAEQITPELCYQQYKELLKTSQIEIFFVGAEESEACKEILTRTFNSIERNFSGNNTTAKSPVKSEVCRVVEEHDVAQSKMVMAFKTDYSEDISMILMNMIFGATPISKLFENVREKLSLCYYCSSGYNDLKGVIYVDSGVEHANTGKAEAEILNQLNAMCSGDFTDEEMDNALKAAINSWKGVSDNFGGITDWYFGQAYRGTSDSPEDRIEKIKKVTREEIIEAAKSLKLDTVYILTGKGGAE